MLVSLGLVAIEVSLCGPISLLTSTFGPTSMLGPGPGTVGAKPGAETRCSLPHQVGFELLSVVPPPAAAPPTGTAIATQTSSVHANFLITCPPCLRPPLYALPC